jgi:hypothetical protein
VASRVAAAIGETAAVTGVTAPGTADLLWDGPTARPITPHVVEVDTADHGMFVPGQLSASAAVFARVMGSVELFLDQLGWP